MGLKLFKINYFLATNNLLEFFWSKSLRYGNSYFDELCVDNPIKTSFKSFELFLDMLVEQIIAVHIHVLGFIILSKLDLISFFD